MAIIIGIDAGLTSPGVSVIETAETNPTGSVLLSECFIPEMNRRDAKGKIIKVKKTEQDTYRIGQIVRHILDICKKYNPEIIVVELPTGGARSAKAIRGMAFSTAMTVAALEALEYYRKGDPDFILAKVIYITPMANKKGGSGHLKWNIPIEQGKWEVMNGVKAIWPDVQWPMKRNRPTEYDDGKCWAMADSLSCIATYLRRQGVLPELK